MKRRIPMYLTLGNATAGFVSIYLCLNGLYSYTLYLILAGSVFDMLDGWAARKIGVSGKNGARADAFSDLVTFGFAPAIFILKVFSDSLGIVIAIAYFMAILYRLIRFRYGTVVERGFIGIPSPLVALAVTAATALLLKHPTMYNPILFIIAVFTLSAVSKFVYPKWGNQALEKFPKWASIIIYLGIMIFFVFNPPAAVLLMMIIYSLIGTVLMLNYRHKKDAKKSAGVS